jgi:hypothetical protein
MVCQSEYKFQALFLGADNPLTIDDQKEELSLRFERLMTKVKSKIDKEEKAFFTSQYVATMES